MDKTLIERILQNDETLSSLDISRFNDAEIRELVDLVKRSNNTNLVKLIATDGLVGDLGVVALSELEHIRELYLAFNSFTEASIDKLKHLFNLTVLEISNNKIGDRVFQELLDMKSLKVLAVCRCGITNISVEKILGNDRITTLFLDGNDGIDDDRLAEIHRHIEKNNKTTGPT